jgi:hypothetical protein
LRRLIIRPGGIGDCILSFPAMEHLRADYTEVWAPSPILPLVRFADQVSSIASTGIDLMGLHGITPPSQLIRRLRGFDSIASWYGSNRAEFREQVRALELPFKFLTALPPKNSPIHCADFFLQQAGGSGPAIPCMRFTTGPRDECAIIHPFSGSPRKNWPLDRFRELAHRLKMPVSWSAGPQENLPDAKRFDDVSDLARWLAGACLYIGNDSGISHLAAAVGTPTVAVFGPTDPSVWAPRGDHVRVVAGDLESVSVDQVLEAAADALRVD